MEPARAQRETKTQKQQPLILDFLLIHKFRRVLYSNPVSSRYFVIEISIFILK